MSTESPRPSRLRAVALAGVFSLAFVACNADGPDAHLAGGEGAAEAENGEAETGTDDGASTEEVTDEMTEPESGGNDSGETEATEPESGGDESAPETFPPNGEVLNVKALDNTFIDEVVEIEAGTEILWTNNGRNEHNVLPADETLEWGVDVEDFAPTDEYSLVFDTPGEYPYYCSIHGTTTVGMIGTIIVTG